MLIALWSRLAGLHGRLQNRLRPKPCQTVLHPRLRLWNTSGAPRFPLIGALHGRRIHVFVAPPGSASLFSNDTPGNHGGRDRERRRTEVPTAAGGAEQCARPGRGGGRWSAARGWGGAEAAGVGARGLGGADDGHRRGAARGEEGGRRGAGSLRRRWRELTALEGVRDGGGEGARGAEGGRRGRRKRARRRRSE